MAHTKPYIPAAPIESCLKGADIPRWVIQVCRLSAKYRFFTLPSPVKPSPDGCSKDQLPDIGNKSPKEMVFAIKSCIRWIKAAIKKVERQLPQGKSYMDVRTPRLRHNRACLQRQIRELDNWREFLVDGGYEKTKEEEVDREIIGEWSDEANIAVPVKVKEGLAPEIWVKKEERDECKIKVEEID